MPIKKIVHNIRNKPPEKRDKYIWVITIAVAGLLFMIWMLVGNGNPKHSDSDFVQNFEKNLGEGKQIIDPNLLKNP